MLFLGVAVASLAVVVSSQPTESTLPEVDLGYTIQRASEFNTDGKYYNFSNIRYGEAPVGELRFAKPVAAKEDRNVQKGDVARICNQAFAQWILYPEFTKAYTTGQDLTKYANVSLAPPPFNESALPPPDPRETEDCLFLDLFVPEKIFKKRPKDKKGDKEEKKKNKDGAPVIVWIHGGGYVFGHKTVTGSPAGIIERSDDGIIFVSINYRLGAFGWLSGTTFQADGTANVGLLDQRLALEWVRDNVAAFGGDPERVTVMGESAGGGSIMHHLTADGGTTKALFQQAIIQSPGWVPLNSPVQQEELFKTFLESAKVKSIEEARGLDSKAIRIANVAWVGLAPYGDFNFGPAVDGSLVTDIPNKLLLDGKFDKSVKIMSGQNSLEGLSLIPPNVQSEAAFNDYLKVLFPTADDATRSYIADTLYPSVLDGSLGYTTQLQRIQLLAAELVYTCSTAHLARAYGNATYDYNFAVPPSEHAQDLPYTFYAGKPEQNPLVTNTTIAILMQDYFTNFAISGEPNGGKKDKKKDDKLPTFEPYGADAGVLRLNVTGVERVRDPADNARCTWWQLGLYDN
ncbi:MAG: hypothetical protein M1832_004621 [Thelocarpon impressellum]|nr:MAG: hypothetical protein M1832_004621 [Thelocarpon impressellum]